MANNEQQARFEPPKRPKNLQIFLPSPLSDHFSPLSAAFSFGQAPSTLQSPLTSQPSLSHSQSPLAYPSIDLPEGVIPDFENSLLSSTLAGAGDDTSKIPLGQVENGKSEDQFLVSCGYVSLSLISSNFNANIIKALHINTGEHVALKRLAKQSKRQQEVGEKSVETSVGNLMELDIHRQLWHPYICPLLDVLFYSSIENDDFVYLVLPFYSNGDLYELVTNRGCLCENEARKYFVQCISAVKYCHESNIVHRDLKLENFMLDVQGKSVKLIDFGLAQRYSIHSLMIENCGSPNYFSPEMIANKQYHGPDVDVWSLGVLLFAMITGQLPFHDERTSKMYSNIATAKYRWPVEASLEVKDLISKIFKVDNTQRISIDDVLNHPWVNINRDELAKDDDKFSIDRASFLCEQVAIMLKMDEDEVSRILQLQEPSNVYATFYLLKQRLSKEFSVVDKLPKLVGKDIVPSGGYISSFSHESTLTKDESEDMLINSLLANSELSPPSLDIAGHSVAFESRRIKSNQILKNFNR